MTTITTAETRPLFEIAREIRADWARPWFGAVPYLQALGSLTSITDTYGADDADLIVRYFLGNATTWRGPVARRIKSELRAMIAR
jgi:hypothetical protein